MNKRKPVNRLQRVHIDFVATKEMADRLASLAEAEERTRSDVVRRLLASALGIAA